MLSRLFILFIFLLPKLCFAEGGHTNGGGGGVYCEVGQRRTLVTLDYFEAKTHSVGLNEEGEWPADFYLNAEDVVESSLAEKEEESFAFYKELLNVMKPLPMLYDLVDSYNRSDIMGETHNEDLDLNEYADSGREFSFPVGCRYVQLIVRDGSIFKMNKRMLKLLSPKQLAILTFHEAIYYAAKDLTPSLQDSRSIRKIIGKVLEIKYFGASRPTDMDYYPANSNYSYDELCEYAGAVNLCTPHVRGELLIQDQYSMVFNDFYESVIQPIEEASARYVAFLEEDRNIVTIKIAESEINNVPSLVAHLQDEILSSGDKILTIPEIEKSMSKANLLLGQCDSINLLSPLKKRVCQNMLTAFSVSVSRLVNGYTKRYCIEMRSGELSCVGEVHVPGVPVRLHRSSLEDFNEAHGVYRFLDYGDVDKIQGYLWKNDHILPELILFSNPRTQINLGPVRLQFLH